MSIRSFVEAFAELTGTEDWTHELEQEMQRVLAAGTAKADIAERAHALLVDIEKWKADCVAQRTGNARRNAPEDVLAAMCLAAVSATDLRAFEHVQSLIGFGRVPDAETGQRPAKAASALLRFLDPDRWGTVDWRNMALRLFIDRHGFTDKAWQEAQRTPAREFREMFAHVGVQEATDMQAWYRERAVENQVRVADIDMAVFGMSLKAWPMKR